MTAPKATFEAGPMPKNTVNSGKNSTIGIAKMPESTGSNASVNRRERPMKNPAAIPVTTAIA